MGKQVYITNMIYKLKFDRESSAKEPGIAKVVQALFYIILKGLQIGVREAQKQMF